MSMPLQKIRREASNLDLPIIDLHGPSHDAYFVLLLYPLDVHLSSFLGHLMYSNSVPQGIRATEVRCGIVSAESFETLGIGERLRDDCAMRGSSLFINNFS